LLLHHRIDFPKSHDISVLIKLLPSDLKIPLSPDQQSKLTYYAIAGRYPIDMDPISKKDAEEALDLAQKVREYIRSALQIRS
jgi:HEPN domain-containing protein